MKLHLRALLLGSLLATLVPLASAHAAPGPPGSLAPLATPQLCFSQTPASGCTSAPGLESARAVAITADGHNLYVGGGTTISVFARDCQDRRADPARGPARMPLVVGRDGLRPRARTERRGPDRALAGRTPSLRCLVHLGLRDRVRA